MPAWRNVFGTARRTVRAAWLMLDSPAANRLCSVGFDTAVIDLQHGLTPTPTPCAMASLTDAGAVPLVRVASNDPPRISRALDAGARGVICPMVNSKEDAEALVSAVRYPPEGSRSFGPNFGVPGTPASPQEANSSVVILAMVETAEAVDAVESILQVPGLDGIFLGPMDLGLALGCDPHAGVQGGTDAGSPVEVAIKRVREAAHRSGKRVGIYCGTAQAAAEREIEGFDLVVPFTDIAGLKGSAAASLATIEGGVLTEVEQELPQSLEHQTSLRSWKSVEEARATKGPRG